MLAFMVQDIIIHLESTNSPAGVAAVTFIKVLFFLLFSAIRCFADTAHDYPVMSSSQFDGVKHDFHTVEVHQCKM